MYALHKQLHPPTGIEQSIYCNFLSPTEKNLVVIGSSELQVYRLNCDAEVAGKSEDVKPKRSRLECLASFSLFGTVVSVQPVRLTGFSRDCLLLAFMDAKLSLIEYDQATDDLKTLSLHYFEDEELKDSIFKNVHLPQIRVDPDGRCVVMLIYGSRLVVLPFRRDIAVDELDMSGSKSPFMSSYHIDLRHLDEKITNVQDIQFLHGYYEPTVFILYEPIRTWTGRIAVRMDTCCIAAISLNMQEKLHPIIWSIDQLPFDCQQAIAVPKPIGGALVLAVNSLLYLNQSVPPYGVSLNSITDGSTNFPLRKQDGVRMALDCCKAAFIDDDKIVMSLKGGELYVLTLLVDGMRCVRGFNFDKAAASVLTTCMCMCEEGYLFLGSRLGNSLLLKYTEKATEGGDVLSTVTDTATNNKEPPSKKKRLDTMGDWMASDISQLDDIDELEVYGTEATSGTQITSYIFEVCDSITNIGPCGRMVMGEPAFLSEEFNTSVDPDIELVTTSGYSKNGALTVVQRSIRPQVVTTFELPGCLDMWTVIGPSSSEEKLEGDSEERHAFLILSREESTMILQTGQEMMELDHSGFSTQAPTVYAGNIGGNKYIMQVSPNGVRLLEGATQLQHIPIDIGSPLVHCSVADPFVLILSEKGQIMMLTLRQDQFGSGVRLAVLRPQVSQKSKVVTLCAYKDFSNMFTTTGKVSEIVPEMTDARTKLDSSVFTFDNSTTTADDEDEMLYGDSEPVAFTSPTPKTEDKEPKASKIKENAAQEIKTSFWVALYRENGLLEIFTLPDFKLVFSVKLFPIGHKVLVDSISSSEGSEKVPDLSELPQVKELLLVGMGNKGTRPYLMARVDQDLLLYEAFPYHQANIDNHLKVRFKKIDHGLILRERKFVKRKKAEGAADEDSKPAMEGKFLRYFQDISGYSGVFVCGPYPHWLIMTAKGCLRTHPMSIDGAVMCFAAFHNVNCPKGFLYFNRQGELRISVLPTHLSYDAHWPVRKVPLRCTARFLCYHTESKVYAMITCQTETCMKLTKIVGDEKEDEFIERDDRFVYPFSDKFVVYLFSPVSWEMVPGTKLELDEWEHATCLQNVMLKSEGVASGMQPCIAVGTTYCNSEDITSRGRIIIFDIIEVVPEPGQPLTKNKIKVLYDKEQKGPVSALAHVQGYLVSAVGQKIYLWQLKDKDLIAMAFIDTQVYIHSLTTVKNLILAADIQKSITVFRWQPDMRTLSQVSRDVKPLEVYGCEFFVDNTQLGFLATDSLKNLILFMYQPEARESHGGCRLVRRADYNIGHHVNTLFRVRCKLSDPSTEKKATTLTEKKHVTYFASLDGSIEYLLPIPEKTYRRLLMLQNVLTTQIPHHAGLNPKAYRSVQSQFKSLSNPNKNILDGDLIWKYLNLTYTERTEMAKRIGTSDEQLMDDLIEIDRTTAHF